MTESPEETAKRLLPCTQVARQCYEDNHSMNCPAGYRPAIAAALAELSHSVMGLETCCDSYLAELEDVRAERDNWKGRFETMEGFWRELKADNDELREIDGQLRYQLDTTRAERDEARKEPERLYYEYEQHLQTLNAENESLKAERDAAYVRGLELALKIAYRDCVEETASAIQAAIDKAGKSKEGKE